MKIIGKAEATSWIATITEEEIAVLLGFRSAYDDAFKAWLAKHRVYGASTNLAGAEVQVVPVGQFWNAIIYKEDDIKKTAATLRALADLITTNLPSGLVSPKPPPAKDD